MTDPKSWHPSSKAATCPETLPFQKKETGNLSGRRSLTRFMLWSSGPPALVTSSEGFAFAHFLNQAFSLSPPLST